MNALKQTSILLISLTSASGCRTISEVNNIGKELFDEFIKEKSHQVVKDYIGGAIRLGFHDAGTFDPATNNGVRLTGPTGCIPMKDEANFGLDTFIESIDEIFQKNKERCIQADFWYLVGAVAIDAAIANADALDNPGSDANKEFKNYVPGGTSALDTFVWGRDSQDQIECELNKFDLLPKHQLGIEHIRKVFADRMGFNNREITALMGAHSIGTCHRENSGFNLPWDKTDTALDNIYYKNILDTTQEWARANVEFDKHVNGPMSRNMWLNLKDGATQINMLNTDMALLWDFGSNDAASASYSSHEFCQIGLGMKRAQVATDNWAGWKTKDTAGKSGFSIAKLVCPNVKHQQRLRTRKLKKKKEIKQCKRSKKSKKSKVETTSDVVEEYAGNAAGQIQFQKDFIAAWNKMAALGYKVKDKSGSEIESGLSYHRQLKNSKKSKKSNKSTGVIGSISIGIIPNSVTLQSPCLDKNDLACLNKNN